MKRRATASLGSVSQMTRPDRRSWLALYLAVPVLTLAGCGRAQAVFHSIDITGADYGRSFRLPGTSGATRSLDEFTGKLVMLFFAFTHCPDFCPTTLARAVEAKSLLGGQGDKLQVIMVSIDPERDTPSLLRQYVSAFDPSFIALRGEAAELERVAGEFKVFYQRVAAGNSYTMDHTTLSYVFDTTGRLRLAVPHTLSAGELADDLRVLLD